MSDISPARDRIHAEIVDMMTTGIWRASKSHRELAGKYGVSVGYVKNIATEAGRFIHDLMCGPGEQEREAARARILSRLEDTREKCMAEKKYKEAIEVDKLELLCFGLNAPTKHEVEDVTEQRKKLAAMTPQERIALHEQKIAEERAKLQETRH